MRVISHGREDLEVELSGVNYYFLGGFGRGESPSVSSVFCVFEIYKVLEEYPMPMAVRNKLADFYSGMSRLVEIGWVEKLRNPDIPYITNHVDIDEQEKQWVRETVCAEWEKDDSRYTSCCDISFYDKNGKILCTNDNRVNVLTILDLGLEIHMDGTIVQFYGEKRGGTFVALASSMMWQRPTERRATKEEFETCVKKLKQYYKTLPRKNRHRIIFVNNKEKKLCSIR